MTISSKIVVFDLDETLGYFVEFGIFWSSIIAYKIHQKIDLERSVAKGAGERGNSVDVSRMSYELTQNDFNKILDLYPEFIRPNIISILNYLKHKKMSKECSGVMIYTNNQGPKQWVMYIKEYFEHKIKYNLFNHIIAAFKVNGKHVELCRTSHDKTYGDFIKCSKIPHDVQICYLDDTYYPEMNAENVYYIKVKPYTHDLSFDDMIHKFVNSEYGESFISNKKDFIEFMKVHISKYQFMYVTKPPKEYDVDKIITKKIMVHLQSFFSKKFQIKYKHHNITTKVKNQSLSSSSSSKKNKTAKTAKY